MRWWGEELSRQLYVLILVRIFLFLDMYNLLKINATHSTFTQHKESKKVTRDAHTASSIRKNITLHCNARRILWSILTFKHVTFY